MTDKTSKPTDRNSSIPRIVLGLMFTVILLILAAFAGDMLSNKSTDSNLPVINNIDGFVLTNQLGNHVGTEDLLGKVWVADVFFTRCPGPCLRLSEKMSALQNRISGKEGVHLVSITSDPEHDVPRVLSRYAEKFNVDPERWWMLTGAPETVRRICLEEMLFVVQEKEQSEQESINDLFIHSTYFMVVDKKGRIRAKVEALEEDSIDTTIRIVDELLGEK